MTSHPHDPKAVGVQIVADVQWLYSTISFLERIVTRTTRIEWHSIAHATTVPYSEQVSIAFSLGLTRLNGRSVWNQSIVNSEGGSEHWQIQLMFKDRFELVIHSVAHYASSW